MKVLIVLVGLAAVLANVEAGGYTAKGGVYDFKKPLDYLDQAVNAGNVTKRSSKCVVKCQLRRTVSQTDVNVLFFQSGYQHF